MHSLDVKLSVMPSPIVYFMFCTSLDVYLKTIFFCILLDMHMPWHADLSMAHHQLES